MLKTGLRVLLFDANLASPTLVDDLTPDVQGLIFTTKLHGGFEQCSFHLATTIPMAWQYLAEASKTAGRHFFRIVIYEEQNIIWEGRITDIVLDLGDKGVGLRISAFGYWSSLRDQYYSDDDAGHTDWTSGSHTADDIIKEMLTEVCPSINADQTNIQANSRDIAGINLSARNFPQDVIVRQLAAVSDSDNSIWHFAIWDNRIAYWSPRSIATLDYRVQLSDTSQLALNQSVSSLRNAITPLVDTTEGTTVTNATSLAFYPRREFLFTLPTGSVANSQADAAETLAEERGYAAQVQRFQVTGHIFQATTGDSGNSLAEIPKWRVRAGQTIRIDDLVPQTITSPSFDRLRTFLITKTVYTADTDTLTVYPDTLPRTLTTILSEFGEIEARR